MNAAFGNRSYNPETIVFNVLPLKDRPKSSEKPEEDEYYQYDLFTNTFRKLDTTSLKNSANFYISGSQNLCSRNDSSKSKWQKIRKRACD